MMRRGGVTKVQRTEIFLVQCDELVHTVLRYILIYDTYKFSLSSITCFPDGSAGLSMVD